MSYGNDQKQMGSHSDDTNKVVNDYGKNQAFMNADYNCKYCGCNGHTEIYCNKAADDYMKRLVEKYPPAKTTK